MINYYILLYNCVCLVICIDDTAVLIGISEPTFSGIEGNDVIVRFTTTVPEGTNLPQTVDIQFSTRSGSAISGKIGMLCTCTLLASKGGLTYSRLSTS